MPLTDVTPPAGNITCAAYPLPGLDSIDMQSGKIDRNSALNLIAFGVGHSRPMIRRCCHRIALCVLNLSTCIPYTWCPPVTVWCLWSQENMDHLDMLDGVIIDLLVAKWNAFVKLKYGESFQYLLAERHECILLLRPDSTGGLFTLIFLPNSRKRHISCKTGPKWSPSACSMQYTVDRRHYTEQHKQNTALARPDPPRQRRANAGPQVASRGWPILGHSTRSPTSARHKARRAEARGASVTSVQLSWVAVKAGIAAPRSAKAPTAAGAAGLGSVGSLAGKLNRLDLTSVAGPEPRAAADRGASL